MSIVSIISFFLLLRGIIGLIWIIIICAFLGLTLILSIIEWRHQIPKKYKSPEKINKYMEDILLKGGNSVVFTKDMTWTKDNEKIKNIMFKKSKNHELTIIMPIITDFASKLKEAGAEVYEYPKLNVTPKSRFTIINYEHGYALMAIGTKDKYGVHCISEYKNGHDTQFHLAEDLVSIIKSYNNNDK